MRLDNFQIYIELPLLTLGVALASWLTYRALCERPGRDFDRGKGLLAAFFGGAAGFFLMILWFIPYVETGNTVRRIVSTQYENCKEADLPTGDFPTNEQCKFFQNVLNGKYSSSEQNLDIRSFLGED